MKRYRNDFDEDRESFDPWSVYSDLYCGLLLVFVLLFFFAIYRYLSLAEINQQDTQNLHAQMQTEQQAVLALYKADFESQEKEIEEKNKDLNQKSAIVAITLADIEDRENLLREKEEELSTQQQLITEQNGVILSKQTQLADQQSKLEEKQTLLDVQSQQLAEQKAELEMQQTLLATQSQQLAEQEGVIVEQQLLLQNQAQQIEDIVGVQSALIRSLNQHLQANGIQVLADAETGAIVFDSSLLFELGSAELKEEGKAFIREFFPLYMDVLLRPEYRDYVAEIIVEGHTDAAGSYLYNLELSQRRALSVASYCLDESNAFLDEEVRTILRKLIAANGKSYSNPIYNENGEIDAQQSRRVEIQFRLKDQEMVRALDEILSENGAFEE